MNLRTVTILLAVSGAASSLQARMNASGAGRAGNASALPLGVVPASLGLEQPLQPLSVAAAPPQAAVPSAAEPQALRAPDAPPAFSPEAVRELARTLPQVPLGFLSPSDPDRPPTTQDLGDEGDGGGWTGVAARLPRAPKPMPPAARALRVPLERAERGGVAAATRLLGHVFDFARGEEGPARRPVRARDLELALAH